MSVNNLLLVLFLILGLTSATPQAQAADDKDQIRYSNRSDRADRLIRNGVALHDEGKYYEAVAAYEEALLEDPGNIVALYELALAYVVAGDYEKAHLSARRGMGNRSPLVAELYSLSATALDKMGRPEEAVLEFVQAIKLFPNNYSLNFNLAVTYAGLDDYDKAEEAVEHTLRIKPDHSSSHLMLGQLYARKSQNIPALMALGRFLSLEPNSARTDAAIDGVKELLKADFKFGEDGAPILLMNADNIVDPDGKDTGYKSIATQLKVVSMSAAISQKENKESSFTESPEYFGLSVLGSLVAKQTKFPTGFAKTHYVPFYTALQEKAYNEPFARLALASLDPGGASDWMKANRNVFGKFTQWSRNYAKPRDSKP